MTILKNTLSLFSLCTLIVLSSCNDDDGGGSGLVSKNEAKTTITTFNTTATDDLQDLADVEGIEALRDLFDLAESDDPFGRMRADKKKVKAFFRKHGRAFKSIVTSPAANARVTASEPFNFDEHKGFYEWNPELGEAGEFEKVDAADIIAIAFPTEGSTTNNAQFKLLNYEEVEVYDEEFEEYSYLPTAISAKLYVNQVEKASFTLDVEWDEAGFPLDATITFAVAPYSLTVALDVTAETSSSVSVSLKLNNEILVATSVKVNYLDESKSEESVKNLEGYVQFRNMKIQGTVNAEAANGEEVDWNKIFKLALYSDGKKLAVVVFVEEEEGIVPYFKYADGTKEKVETALQPVLDEIESLTEGLGNNG